LDTAVFAAGRFGTVAVLGAEGDAVGRLGAAEERPLFVVEGVLSGVERWLAAGRLLGVALFDFIADAAAMSVLFTGGVFCSCGAFCFCSSDSNFC
jgi:hypothetical protein